MQSRCGAFCLDVDGLTWMATARCCHPSVLQRRCSRWPWSTPWPTSPHRVNSVMCWTCTPGLDSGTVGVGAARIVYRSTTGWWLGRRSVRLGRWWQWRVVTTLAWSVQFSSTWVQRRRLAPTLYFDAHWRCCMVRTYKNAQSLHCRIQPITILYKLSPYTRLNDDN